MIYYEYNFFLTQNEDISRHLKSLSSDIYTYQKFLIILAESKTIQDNDRIDRLGFIFRIREIFYFGIIAVTVLIQLSSPIHHSNFFVSISPRH